MEHQLTTVNFHGRPKQLVLPRIMVNEPPRVDYDLSAEKYHSDKTAMNASGVEKLLKSPMTFISWVLGIGASEDPKEEEDHFRFGRAAHMLFLEPEKFRKLNVIEPEFVGLTKDGRPSTQSKEARDKKEKWYADLDPTSIVITQKEMEDLTYMTDSIVSNDIARSMFSSGKPEVSCWWTDKATGIRCRIRPDMIVHDEDGGYHFFDFKTSRDETIGMFSETIFKFRYHIRYAFYYDGLTEIFGREPKTAAFIVTQKKPPYETAVFTPDDYMLGNGRQWKNYALKLLEHCLIKNEFKTLHKEAQMISLPRRAEMDTPPMYSGSEDEQHA